MQFSSFLKFDLQEITIGRVSESFSRYLYSYNVYLQVKIILKNIKMNTQMTARLGPSIYDGDPRLHEQGKPQPIHVVDYTKGIHLPGN